MKAFSKIKQVLNSVPKRVAVVFGITAAVLVPLGIYAWGPSRETFTMAEPATYNVFNSITDNPDVGDERNFLRVRDADEQYWQQGTTNGWTDTISNMQAGHTYDVRMYVHNNAAANLNLTANNVRAHVNLPTNDDTWGKQFEINGYLWSDNANPNEIWDNIVLKSDQDFHVKVVSAKYYNNIRTEKSSGFDLGSDVYTAKGQGTGALLGYEQMDGKIPGCLQYSGYVLLKVQPVFKEPGYDVSKSVDKTAAQPGDTINYTIKVTNTGLVDLTNVKITDQLPAYYSNASEQVTAPGSVTGSIVKDGQITIAKLPVGGEATIQISYQIKGADQLECGNTIITNKATGTTDQDQTEDKDDNNEVTTTVTNDCPEPVPGYDVSKTVDKTTANPGDTLTYTITARNTGEVDLTNVKITDQLPAYYSNATEQVNAPSTVTGSIVKGGQITIASLPVGSTATITISYQIKGEADLACGETVITNKVTSTTDQDQSEDNDDNNQVTTTVNRDCTPGYDVSKSVDKTIAQPGETITYTITVTNTGKVDLTNVVVTDQLPAYYSQATDQIDAPSEITGSIVKDGKVTIAKLPVGSTATIKVSYQIKSSADLKCGNTVIKNSVDSTTDQDQTEDKDDNNEVTTIVANNCEYGYDLTKTVDKTTANPGDTLTYTLTFRNTGRLDLTNVVIKDALPQNVTLVGDIQTKPETKVTGDITGDGLVIDQVKAGGEVQIILTAKIADASQLQVGDNQITNTASSTTDEDDTEDTTENNTATTTVTVPEPEKPGEQITTTTPTPTPTPGQPTRQTPAQPQTPTVIAQTGAGETAATILGVGAIAAALTAYIRSRKYATSK